MTLLGPVVAVLVGLAVLAWAADVFVGGAEGLAVHLRWSPGVIGAVVVGFGTSLPELFASALAAFAGQPALAIGNAAGSNIANLVLILGVAAIVAPIRAVGAGPGRDVAVAVTGSLVLVATALDGRVGALDGVMLVVALLGASTWQAMSGRTTAVPLAARGPVAPLGARVAGGLIGVILGAQALVWGATRIATELEVPAIVIGAVMVAVGTSLPELATAIASARRGQTELLIGNLIGSNAFNALGVVGVAALLGAARGQVLVVDTPALAVVLAAAAVTTGVGLWLWRRPRVSRWAGLLLVASYVGAVPLLLTVA